MQTIPASGYCDPQTLGPQYNSTQPLCQSSLLSLFKCHLLWEGSLDYPSSVLPSEPCLGPTYWSMVPFYITGCLHFPWLVILVQGAFDDAACRVTLCISVSGPQQHHLRCGDAKTYLQGCLGEIKPDSLSALGLWNQTDPALNPGCIIFCVFGPVTISLSLSFFIYKMMAPNPYLILVGRIKRDKTCKVPTEGLAQNKHSKAQPLLLLSLLNLWSWLGQQSQPIIVPNGQ